MRPWCGALPNSIGLAGRTGQLTLVSQGLQGAEYAAPKGTGTASRSESSCRQLLPSDCRARKRRIRTVETGWPIVSLISLYDRSCQ